MRLLFKLLLPKSTPRLLLTTTYWQLKHLQYASCNLPPIKMKIIPAPRIIPKTYINKNESLKRALSPHLSIYKPQITSMMSITLRMTGLSLGIMVWVVGVTALVSDQNVDYFVNELKKLELDDCYWTSAKIVAVFPFAFHFVAGVRHLLFDTSKLLEKPQFYATGYAAIMAAFGLAVCLGMMADICEKWEEMKQDKESVNKGK
ncbi:succinate dehydrogenase cytochrome b560 subunit, mitochondrial [Calliphora vicina]|uniref:succinate dehydrogenase cytochrome b560 subunit, mitochondrial n=1 Tax=Calliphora vicina TaxID=7373 RepID=UPI00325BC267